IVLIVLWSIVLLPPAWQSHAEARRARQVDAFRRKLSVLAPAPDTPLAARPSEAARPHVAVVAPRNVVRLPVAQAEAVEYDTGALESVAAEAAARRAERARARVDVLRRRQQVLVGLMAAVAVSLVAGLTLRDIRVLALHGLTVAALAAYLVALRRLKTLAVERRAKVRYFPAAAPVSAPASASSGAARSAGVDSRR